MREVKRCHKNAQVVDVKSFNSHICVAKNHRPDNTKTRLLATLARTRVENTSQDLTPKDLIPSFHTTADSAGIAAEAGEVAGVDLALWACCRFCAAAVVFVVVVRMG